MPIKEFWCLEGHHFFTEYEHSSQRKYRNAICKACTKKILEEFYKSSDALRMSRIFENITDGREVKRRYERKRYGKKARQNPQVEISKWQDREAAERACG